MKTIIAIHLITYILALPACSKNKNDRVLQHRIKEYRHEYPNVGAIVYSFEYNDKQQINVQKTAGYPAEFDYLDGKVVANYYGSNGTFSYREAYYLDGNGYVIEINRQGGTVRPKYFKVRADGFIEWESQADFLEDRYETKYYYDNDGVMDSMRNYKNDLWVSTEASMEYDKTKSYTAENENRGQAFLGRKFKHPLLKSKLKYVLSQNTETKTSSSTYDDMGRVIKEVHVTSSHQNYTNTYTYY
jgi:hypothetical protein